MSFAVRPDCLNTFGAIAEKNISVDMIIQNTSYDYVEGGATDVTFTLPKSDLARVREGLETLVKKVGGKGVQLDEDICKVSIVGLGMRTHAGVAARMFDVLAKANINVQMISTSEIKISVVIDENYVELAQRVLHDAFVAG